MNQTEIAQNKTASETHDHQDSDSNALHRAEHEQIMRQMAQNESMLNAERRRGRQFALVAEVSRKVASILDLDQMLSETVDLVSGSFGADQVSIHLIDPQDSANLFVAASSTPLGQIEPTRINIGYGMIGWVAQHGEPRLACDVDKDPVFFRAPGLNTASELALPLKAGGVTLGVLNLESNQYDAFAPDEVPILETLAEQVAIAIRNSRLSAQARDLAVAEEREHLARELHDDTVQRLAAVHRQLDLLEEDIEAGHSAAVQQRLHGVQEMVQESMRNVRRISRRLRPALLEELGLVPALEAMTADFNRDSDCSTTVKFNLSGEPRRVKPAVELAIYRIAQEALNNAVKHSAAEEVAVSLRLDEEIIELTVSDNGKGFPQAQCTKAERQGVIGGGMGLSGMRERARSIGATLRIDSTPGNGTTVRLLAALASNSIG